MKQVLNLSEKIFFEKCEKRVLVFVIMIFLVLSANYQRVDASVTYGSAEFGEIDAYSTSLSDGNFTFTSFDGVDNYINIDGFGIYPSDSAGTASTATSAVITIKPADGSNVFMFESAKVNTYASNRFLFEITLDENPTVVASANVSNLVGEYDNSGSDWYYKTISITPTVASAVHIRISGTSSVGNYTSIYEFTVGALPAPPSPDINVLGNGNGILDGDSTPSSLDHTDFGNADISGGSVTRAFTIVNMGTGDLSLTGTPKVNISGADAADFFVTSDPVATVSPNRNTTFHITFAPSTTGAKSASISIANNDSDENPYDFSISGNGTARPEISIKGNGNEIADGDVSPSVIDHTDFGSTDISGGTVSRTFTINNTGKGVLSLTGTPRVSISGANAADFYVTSQPSGQVPELSGSSTFTIIFDPGLLGTKTATVSIANDDIDENPYNFNIQGFGIQGAYTATAEYSTGTPQAGTDNPITLTVKKSDGSTDSGFNGAVNVTISGVAAAPDGTYGSFNGTVLNASSAGVGQTIPVIFTNGTGTASLRLNKAGAQTIGFIIAGVTTPATNALTITPAHGVAASMVVTRDITAPAVNGGTFAQQPQITIRDAYSNVCTSDNATVVTAAKEDAGAWTLTGATGATAASGVVSFVDLGATNDEQVNNAQLGFTAEGLDKVTSMAVTLPAPAGAHTATAAADTATPVAGVDNEITLTVKNAINNTDSGFNGAVNVTISGVAAAPDGTYGSFNGTVLDASSAGVGQTIPVIFTNGTGTASLRLNKAGAQTIGFIIAGVTTPATNALTITPAHGVAASMTVTRDITAPAANGGTFAQQPQITIRDAYSNVCTGDNATVVTAAKEDAGAWTLTGTTTATAVSGVVSFVDLGTTNDAQVNNAQLGFTAEGLDKVISTVVTLPAPAGAHTATAAADTAAPVAGVDNEITLTVKNAINNIDSGFNGAVNVTISGVSAAPDGTYGSFNATVLNASSSGVGQTIPVTFTNGTGTASLRLNKAGAQTIGFSITGVTTPATNTLTITPTHGTAAGMVVTRDIAAPAVNGGTFSQQPQITIRDAYSNVCTGDNATVITAAKEDAGAWTLTGTTAATAVSGVVSFVDLGATNDAQVNNAQLGFTTEGLDKVISTVVTLPAPAGAHTATAAADTAAPVAGVDNEITLTVKNAINNTDLGFNGVVNVVISGVAAAPDGTYGSFNGTVLNASSAGAGQTIPVTFTNGTGTANLRLNKAGVQIIGFSITGVTTPATNTLTITPTHGAAEGMAVTRDIAAPAVNGGAFTQQPQITIRDAYSNVCTGDNVTVITVTKEDAGAWTLTGTTTATVSAGAATFANLGATNDAQVNNAQLGFTAEGLDKVISTVVTLPAPAGARTATAAADTAAPVAGVDNEITLTVKNAINNTDSGFNGAVNVTISGVAAAPDGTYGSFNGTVLNASSAGAGQTIPVTFTNGTGTANLRLNKAGVQTIGFIIAGVTTPATNALTITPTHGAAASMVMTRDIAAPAVNGGTFAQQPKITIRDAYSNVCTGDNTTVITAAKEDAGAWALTGTTSATASAGVATFANLGASNASLVNNAQLGFTSGVMTKVISDTVTLPAGDDDSIPTNPSNPQTQEQVIVIVNGEEQNAGTETKSNEEGKSTITVEVNNKVIESKIDEAVEKNKTGSDNIIQVPVADTESQVVKVELTGDIVKKLEENKFDVSIKRGDVEYVIPAEEFTISNVARELDVAEEDLQDINIEVKISKVDEEVVKKYNEFVEANKAELIFPPVEFEVFARTTKSDGIAVDVNINKFSNYVERVMEIPEGIDPNKITTGIVFNTDGTYSHVPTEVFQKDGKWYARLNSLTNSTYSVIWNPVTVSSVVNHWSKDAVNDMASRLVIFNAEGFEPDKAITRADFAEYIVRALGLYRAGATYTNNFSDVSSNGERALAICIANEYGIITGYPDGTFKPDQMITREEAMTMYARAMKITKLRGIDNDRYKEYTDYDTISSWALKSIEEVLSAHVFNGTSSTTIAPKSNLTYAEAAQAIKNLLVESKLINK